MKSAGLSVLILFLLLTPILGQQKDPVRCVITLYDLRGDRWKLRRSVEFVPKMAEEELTNKTVRFPRTRLVLLASVFPTDESMGSASGVDSLKLGLAMSRKHQGSAFEVPNNAVAEGTLRKLDTLRVERIAYVSGKQMLTRLECWDPNLERDQ